MRPGAILVSIVSLLLSLSVVVWLSNSFGEVEVGSAENRDPAPADDPDTPRPATGSGPHPVAEFAETKFDFGIMRLYDKGSHVFSVKNSGEAPLKLKAGKSTCQCTVGEVGTQELAPGESTTIELSWEIRNPMERFEHSAVIHTNDPQYENGELRLIVHGLVAEELEVMPPEVLNLGTLLDETASESFMFYSQYHDEFQLLSIDCPHESFRTEFAPLDETDLTQLSIELGGGPPMDDGPETNLAKTLKPLCGYRVTVTVDSDVAVGTTEIPLTLHTDIPNHEEFTHTVSVRRPAPFQFFPRPGTRFVPDKSIVSTAAFDAADGATMELLMLATGMDDPLEVSVLSTEPEWLEATVAADQSSQGVPRQRVTIRIPPGSPQVVRGSDNPAVVRLKTNHPESETFDLNVTFLSR